MLADCSPLIARERLVKLTQFLKKFCGLFARTKSRLRSLDVFCGCRYHALTNAPALPNKNVGCQELSR